LVSLERYSNNGITGPRPGIVPDRTGLLEKDQTTLDENWKRS